MIKVLIADDIVLIRKSIKTLINGRSNIEIIGECSNGQEVVGFLEGNNVDVILMDIRMPKLDGIEATKIVSSKYPLVKVIAHSSFSDDTNRALMDDAGAIDYLVKGESPEKLISAITTAYDKS